MGQQASRSEGPLHFHSLDPRSKVGKRASARVSLLTAEERAELVRRSFGLKPTMRQASSLQRSMSRIPDPSLDKNTEAKVKPPPLEGTVQGDQWNRFVVDEVWGQEHPRVIHTIILPEGRDPRNMMFYKPTITKESRYFLTPGEYPPTATHPSRLFEAYIEKDIREGNKKIPAHFLVNSATAPAVKQKADKEDPKRKD